MEKTKTARQLKKQRVFQLEQQLDNIIQRRSIISAAASHSTPLMELWRYLKVALQPLQLDARERLLTYLTVLLGEYETTERFIQEMHEENDVRLNILGTEVKIYDEKHP